MYRDAARCRVGANEADASIQVRTALRYCPDGTGAVAKRHLDPGSGMAHPSRVDPNGSIARWKTEKIEMPHCRKRSRQRHRYRPAAGDWSGVAAQVPGRIEGRVLDMTGGALPGVAIDLVQRGSLISPRFDGAAEVEVGGVRIGGSALVPQRRVTGACQCGRARRGVSASTAVLRGLAARRHLAKLQGADDRAEGLVHQVAHPDAHRRGDRHVRQRLRGCRRPSTRRGVGALPHLVVQVAASSASGTAQTAFSTVCAASRAAIFPVSPRAKRGETASFQELSPTPRVATGSTRYRRRPSRGRCRTPRCRRPAFDSALVAIIVETAAARQRDDRGRCRAERDDR